MAEVETATPSVPPPIVHVSFWRRRQSHRGRFCIPLGSLRADEEAIQQRAIELSREEKADVAVYTTPANLLDGRNCHMGTAKGSTFRYSGGVLVGEVTLTTSESVAILLETIQRHPDRFQKRGTRGGSGWFVMRALWNACPILRRPPRTRMHALMKELATLGIVEANGPEWRRRWRTLPEGLARYVNKESTP